MRAVTTDLPTAIRTRRERSPATKTLGNDLRQRRTGQTASVNVQSEGMRKTHQGGLRTSQTRRETKRTRRQRQDGSRTMESGR